MSAELKLQTILSRAQGTIVLVWTRGVQVPFEGSVVHVDENWLTLGIHAASQTSIRLESIDAVQT